MGFDNECILNIQSLPGEYFCPVCRTLVYPNEAMQAQCTHLYCRPCLAYVAANTHSCPYDGYLVTEADSKPLMESNKSLAETVGNVMVYCLYHKSGCQWQGKLSESVAHGTVCAYGNSPVVCNRCGTQIIHRQVQEHAQLCPGLQQQADSSLTQSSAAATQAVTQDVSAVSSAVPAAALAVAPSTTVPPATTAASLAGAATASTPPPAGQAIAPQTQTAEQYQQQLQYQQYYQQNYPGYNPYTQQYQQYGQYQQAYQQYAQPQMQVALQSVAQAPAQPAPYVQPQVLQPQHIVPNQTHLPQLQAPVVQPQPQHNPSLQSAPQVPQMQPQSEAPLQLTHPQAQPTHVGSQQFAMPATHAATSQAQPHAQPQSAVAQQPQIQHQHSQMQQQSYPQHQVYNQQHPMPHAQPQNPSVHAVTVNQSYPQSQPAHQMPHGASLQHPVHQSHPQVVGPQHPTLAGPPQGQFPLQGQHPTMLAPQGTQHAQRPPMHPSIPSQPTPQGFSLNTSVPSQTGQSYQQGMASSQQMHSQSFQPHGPPFMQQQHVQTSTGRSMSYAAAPQQFKELGKSEYATNATGNTEASDNNNGVVVSAAVKPHSLGDKSLTREQNDFGNVRKDAAQPGIALDGTDGSDRGKGKDEFTGRESNSHVPDVHGDKKSKASNTSNDLEKGGSLQQAPHQNFGAPGSYLPPVMGSHRPSGPDRMLPQHMLHPGPMPYMQGHPDQMRPSKHSFPENIRPPMQQPYGSYQSEMAPRALGPNQNQMPFPHSAPIRPDDGMIRPPMGGPLPGHHDTMMPPFAPENANRPYPIGMTKNNGVGGGPPGSRAFHEEGFNSSQEHFRPFAAYPGRHNVNRNDIEENMKQYPGPTHLDDSFPRGPRPFDGGLGRLDGFTDSLPGRPPFPNLPEFGHHRIDGVPRNPGPFRQGMTAGPVGLPKDQLGSGNLPGNVQHDFDNAEFPHKPFHLAHGQLHGIEPGYRYQGHMHPDGFPQESGHFGPGRFLGNGDVGWCRICMFNCGSAEDLDLHVHTREHQQHAMDIILQMKHDVAKRQKMNSGVPKSFNKKVAGKGNFRGNRR